MASFESLVEQARATSIESELDRRGIKLRKSGAERIGPCPKCGGTDRFSINVKDNVWNCRACKPDGISGDVIGFVEWYDGVEFREAVETLTGEAAPTRKPNGGGNGHAHHEEPAPKKKLGRVIATYPYTDEGGDLLFEVVRYEPKDFRQRRPDGNGGFIADTVGVRMVPYRLPELYEAIANDRMVFLPEGEKDVDNLVNRFHVNATCNARGAGKWSNSRINDYFQGANVVIIADNDPPTTNKKTGEVLYHDYGVPRFAGWDHAHEVAANLKNIAASVKVIDLKKFWPGCPDKGDISDYIDAGGTIEALNAYVEKLDVWQDADAREYPFGFRPKELTATVYIVPDPKLIPRRQWLYGQHYMRGIVTATVAPGGFGKTTLSLYEACTMAVGGLRVWFISGEDDKTELDRRIAAHMKAHNIKPAQLEGRLFIDDRQSFPFKIAKSDKDKVIFDDTTLKQFHAAISRDKIDVVILDPFVTFHALPENDTAAMDALIRRLNDIAIDCTCNIELSHHVRKPPAAAHFEITVYDARGAGAIVNAVRSCRVLNQMPRSLAEAAGIPVEHRAKYIRIDPGKRNMAEATRAVWAVLKNIEIDNGDWEAGIPGDKVQALEAYEYKQQGTTNDDRIWLRATIKNKKYRVSSKSPDWIGVVMATHFNRDVSNKDDRTWLNKTITRWVGEGLLRVIEDKDNKNKKRPAYVAGEALEKDAGDEAVVMQNAARPDGIDLSEPDMFDAGDN